MSRFLIVTAVVIVLASVNVKVSKGSSGNLPNDSEAAWQILRSQPHNAATSPRASDGLPNNSEAAWQILRSRPHNATSAMLQRHAQVSRRQSSTVGHEGPRQVDEIRPASESSRALFFDDWAKEDDPNTVITISNGEGTRIELGGSLPHMLIPPNGNHSKYRFIERESRTILRIFSASNIRNLQNDPIFEAKYEFMLRADGTLYLSDYTYSTPNISAFTGKYIRQGQAPAPAPRPSAPPTLVRKRSGIRRKKSSSGGSPGYFPAVNPR